MEVSRTCRECAPPRVGVLAISIPIVTFNQVCARHLRPAAHGSSGFGRR